VLDAQNIDVPSKYKIRKYASNLNTVTKILAVPNTQCATAKYTLHNCGIETNAKKRQTVTSACFVVPRCRLSTLGPRAFSVVGQSLWNSLPDSLRDPDLRRLLKTYLFLDCTEAFSVLEIFQENTLYKLTYLLTYYKLAQQSSEKRPVFVLKSGWSSSLK